MSYEYNSFVVVFVFVLCWLGVSRPTSDDATEEEYSQGEEKEVTENMHCSKSIFKLFFSVKNLKAQLIQVEENLSRVSITCSSRCDCPWA